MMGALPGESTGKRIVRRVLESNPLTVELPIEDSGTMLGIATNGLGTYTSVVSPDGSLYGEGHGLISTKDGCGRGRGRGKFCRAVR
jgi:hypothetical protein